MIRFLSISIFCFAPIVSAIIGPGETFWGIAAIWITIATSCAIGGLMLLMAAIDDEEDDWL